MLRDRMAAWLRWVLGSIMPPISAHLLAYDAIRGGRGHGRFKHPIGAAPPPTKCPPRLKPLTAPFYPDLSARPPCLHGVLLLFAIMKSAANLGP